MDDSFPHFSGVQCPIPQKDVLMAAVTPRASRGRVVSKFAWSPI
jgi:hypothetical protein